MRSWAASSAVQRAPEPQRRRGATGSGDTKHARVTGTIGSAKKGGAKKAPAKTSRKKQQRRRRLKKQQQSGEKAGHKEELCATAATQRSDGQSPANNTKAARRRAKVSATGKKIGGEEIRGKAEACSSSASGARRRGSRPSSSPPKRRRCRPAQDVRTAAAHPHAREHQERPQSHDGRSRSPGLLRARSPAMDQRRGRRPPARRVAREGRQICPFLRCRHWAARRRRRRGAARRQPDLCARRRGGDADGSAGQRPISLSTSARIRCRSPRRSLEPKRVLQESLRCHDGTSKIKATIHLQGNFIQQMELSFDVGAKRRYRSRRVGALAAPRPPSRSCSRGTSDCRFRRASEGMN